MHRTVALLAVFALVPLARAEDKPVRGLLFAITDPLPGVDASRRHVTVKGRTRVHAPLAGDPLANGGTVEVFANGATSTSEVFVLPPGAFASPDGPGWTTSARRRRASFRYADEHGVNGPVTALLISQSGANLRIYATLDGRDSATGIGVVPPNPGTDGGVIVTVNGGDSYCLLFGGAVRGKIRDNDDTAFRIAKPRGQACPSAP